MKSTTLAGTVLAAALLTACGGDAGSSDRTDAAAGADASAFTDLTGEEIAAASKEVMSGLESLRVVGEVTADGKAVALDLAVAAGGSCAGTVTLDADPVEVIAVDGTVWIRPEADFWRHQLDDAAQAEQLIAQTDGKWVFFGEGASGFEDFCDLDDITGEDEDEETYEKGEVTDVDGTEAVAVTSTGADGEESVGYVQVEDEHYLLRVETQGDQPGTITFSDFDVPVEVAAPDEADVVDLS